MTMNNQITPEIRSIWKSWKKTIRNNGQTPGTYTDFLEIAQIKGLERATILAFLDAYPFPTIWPDYVRVPLMDFLGYAEHHENEVGWPSLFAKLFNQ